MPRRRLRSRNPSFVSLYVAVTLSVVCLFTTTQQLSPKEMKGDGVEEKVKGVLMTSPGELTEQEGKHLLRVARKTIEKALFQHDQNEALDRLDSPKFSEKRGTFVTLTIDGGLRGCIGHIIPQELLIEGVKTNAINAAFHDPRFRPLSKNEFEKIRIEISILTKPKALIYSDAKDLLTKLQPRIDGVIIKKSYHQATFLPQVWEQLPDKGSFLNQLCLKAGLDGDVWKYERLEVSVYQVQAFQE